MVDSTKAWHWVAVALFTAVLYAHRNQAFHAVIPLLSTGCVVNWFVFPPAPKRGKGTSAPTDAAV
jgi:hypothetical protein